MCAGGIHFPPRFLKYGYIYAYWANIANLNKTQLYAPKMITNGLQDKTHSGFTVHQMHQFRKGTTV